VGYPAEIESEPDRLTRIEAKLNYVIGRVEAFEEKAGAFLDGPARNLLKLFGRGS